MSAPPSGNAYPTLADVASTLAPFLGRRLRGIWRLHDAKAGVTDLWLAFNERPEAPDVVRLTATPVTVLPVIDFPNLLTARCRASGDTKPSFVIVENRWVERPADQVEWSEAVHAAHSHALDGYWDWEAIFQ